MSKYTTEQLKEMAQEVIECRKEGKLKPFFLATILGSHFGLSHLEVWERIEEFANAEITVKET